MMRENFDAAEAKELSELIKQAIADQRVEGFSENALMAGSLSAAVSLIASNVGPEFAAALCEQAADELRGAGHA